MGGVELGEGRDGSRSVTEAMLVVRLSAQRCVHTARDCSAMLTAGTCMPSTFTRASSTPSLRNPCGKSTARLLGMSPSSSPAEAARNFPEGLRQTAQSAWGVQAAPSFHQSRSRVRGSEASVQ